MRKYGLIILVIAGLISTFLKLGKDIPIEKQLMIISALKDVATIIFGVIGAWIAILYPDRLSTVYEGVKSNRLKNFDKLISPLLCATLIIAISLLYIAFRPLVSENTFAVHHKLVFRSISYNLILFLTFTMLWNLILSIWPMDTLRRKIGKDETDQSIREMYGGK